MCEEGVQVWVCVCHCCVEVRGQLFKSSVSSILLRQGFSDCFFCYEHVLDYLALTVSDCSLSLLPILVQRCWSYRCTTSGFFFMWVLEIELRLASAFTLFPEPSLLLLRSFEKKLSCMKVSSLWLMILNCRICFILYKV